MTDLTKALLGSVALCALATSPATAARLHPAMHVTALHAGQAVNKTVIRGPKAQNLTYTFGIYATVSFASAFHKKVPVASYKWNSSNTLCSSPMQKMKVAPKKTAYAKIGTATETYSEGCPSGPTTFYSATYDIFNPDAKGKLDYFVATLYGKFKNSGTKYKGKLIMDVNVTID